jgi:hypothetical protein
LADYAPDISGGFAGITDGTTYIIYATPVAQHYIETGSAFWKVAEPISEYWLDIAGDRAFPLHNFVAASDYVTTSGSLHLFAGLADVSFAAGGDISILGRVVPVNISESFNVGAIYTTNSKQDITQIGAAVAVFTTPGEYPALDRAPDIGVAEFVYASHDIIGFARYDAFVEGGTMNVVTSASIIEVSVQPDVPVIDRVQ